MSRISFVSSKCFSLVRQPSFSCIKRTFLSEAYQCREAWEKRLDSPILKKVNTQNLFQEIDWQYSQSGNISAIDADIFINANTKKGFMEDIEDVICKLRRSPDTVNTPVSSHHAAVRLMLDAGKTDALLKMISNRLQYGIFPDHFCLHLLMDTFLKEGKYAAAARVAVLQMLQEDWENLLTTRLAMYSCHMYLRNLEQEWYAKDEIAAPEPEPKDVIKVRVKYLRKPYFDDHFDLQDPMLLVGKTLCMFSSKVGASEQLAASYYLLGLTLHQKWDQVLDLANKLASAKLPIHREAFEIAKKFLEPTPQAEEPVAEVPKSSKPTKADPAKEAKEAALKAEVEMKQKVSQVLSGLEESTKADDMLAEMNLLVKESVKLQESQEIQKQKELYVRWEEERLVALRNQQEVIRKEDALKRIEQQKLDIIEEEKRIFFFENQDKLDLMIESNEEARSKINEKMKSVKESKTSKDADYVPPEVFKRYK